MPPTKKQVDLRKGCWQGIGWLWSADFVVGVEHVDVLNYFCLLIRWSFTVVILKILAWCRLCFIYFGFLLTSFLSTSTKYLINLYIYLTFFWEIILCRPCLPSAVCSYVTTPSRTINLWLIHPNQVMLAKMRCHVTPMHVNGQHVLLLHVDPTNVIGWLGMYV